MVYTTLISSEELLPHLDDPRWALIDCRFDLADPAAGQAAYLAEHIPGAVYAHLERDLSAPPTGTNGRHPLPPPGILAAVFSRWGIGHGVQVIVYDDSGGGYAARAWWSLRFLGHDAVAVLDGGLQAWVASGHPVRQGLESRRPASFSPSPRSELKIEADQVLAGLGSPGVVLIDARAPERFRGEEEPIDPVAGHIPGALNRPWQTNLDASGRFLPAIALRQQFEALLGASPASSAVAYCGSGVTACHNLLAMAHAGLLGARLYPGSWSEWSSSASRPVATGDDQL
jgi:thiosulfate/3-mercaptopyruvate sulfurtransferase